MVHVNLYKICHFFLKTFLEDISPFCWATDTQVLFDGPLIPLLWTSGHISSGFQSQWAALFALGRGIHVTCFLIFTLYKICHFFVKHFWRTQVLFVGPLIPKSFSTGHWYPCYGLLVTYPLGSKASGQLYLHLAEAYMLHVSWYSPLVWHLPTSSWPAWQPSIKSFTILWSLK